MVVDDAWKVKSLMVTEPAAAAITVSGVRAAEARRAGRLRRGAGRTADRGGRASRAARTVTAERSVSVGPPGRTRRTSTGAMPGDSKVVRRLAVAVDCEPRSVVHT